MYRILHVSADYLQCSFEFENMETRKQENRRTCNDSLHDFLSLFKLQSNHEFEGKVIFLS